MDRWEYAIKNWEDFSKKTPYVKRTWGEKNGSIRCPEFTYEFDPEMLNEFGRQGWELIAAESGDGFTSFTRRGRLIFKRKIN